MVTMDRALVAEAERVQSELGEVMGSLLEDLGGSASPALRGGIVGLSDDEIEAVRVDQGVTQLPARYIEFLRLMGRKAGSILVGTDIFYPDTLGLKPDGKQLLEENGLAVLISENSVVFAMHQGYQVYWMTSDGFGDPPVFMYQEGDETVSSTWPSFSAFLTHYASS